MKSCHCRSVFPDKLPCLDTLGIACSSLCLVHCILMPFLIAFVPALLSRHDDRTHMILAGFVVLFFCFAIIPGYRKHHDPTVFCMAVPGLVAVLAATFGHCPDELPLITFGNLLVVAAHVYNRHMSLGVKLEEQR